MEQQTQKVLYHIIRGTKPVQILRNMRLNATELRKHILVLLEMKLIEVFKSQNKIVYILSEEGKTRYRTYLSDDMILKLKIEAYTK